MTEQIGTRPKKTPRGRAKQSIALVKAMYGIAEAAQPITGRGVGYKLFVAGLIPSMKPREMKRVYRLLKEERERGNIPWEWIVDETRDLERTATWDNPAEFAEHMTVAYQRDNWDQQPHRVEVWSEKGTVRGVLRPVLDELGVGFRVMHGFSSATAVYDVASSDDERPLIVLYVGDRDPSGMFMSEADLPKRLVQYGGHHVDVRRLALTEAQIQTLPSFPATDKKKDTRYKWFVTNHGDRCWELDAMDPNDLRQCVGEAIRELIEPVAWDRCEVVNRAQRESLEGFLKNWNKREQFETFRREWVRDE
jgi:hypothetical protein